MIILWLLPKYYFYNDVLWLKSVFMGAYLLKGNIILNWSHSISNETCHHHLSAAFSVCLFFHPNVWIKHQFLMSFNGWIKPSEFVWRPLPAASVTAPESSRCSGPNGTQLRFEVRFRVCGDLNRRPAPSGPPRGARILRVSSGARGSPLAARASQLGGSCPANVPWRAGGGGFTGGFSRPCGLSPGLPPQASPASDPHMTAAEPQPNLRVPIPTNVTRLL